LSDGDPAEHSVDVLYHSIVWGYLPEDTQSRIAAHLVRRAESATRTRPLAWLRFELDAASPPASLRLRVWPDGEDLLLAQAQPHVASVTLRPAAARWRARALALAVGRGVRCGPRCLPRATAKVGGSPAARASGRVLDRGRPRRSRKTRPALGCT